MKKLFLYFLIFLPVIGFNQVVNHFENTNSQWFVARNFINANQENPSHLGVKTWIHSTIGDTIIDNSNWLKLYSSQDSLFQNNILSSGFLRSEGSKVYYKSDATSQSHLIYDFSLDVGDSTLYTISVAFDTIPSWIYVNQIDTIDINGEPYRRFHFTEPDIPYQPFNIIKEVWIEGIGSVHGPLSPMYPMPLGLEWGQRIDLTCSFSNETHYYHFASYYTECFVYDVLDVKNLQKELVKIYPNPAKDFLTISNMQNDDMDVEITNNLGQTILNTKINSNQYKVDIRNLKNGVYFLKLKQGDTIQISKIIKE
ncbi:MAG: T9SS type A sorting domain-containing protein [Brumimicrobium sp.]|nr:T9SS type A sorting domain-containing protein [Brumimicrobium sp.]